MTGLNRCVGDAAGFLEHHWTRAPLHRPGTNEHAFADLLSLDDVDHIVSSSSPRLPAFRLVRNGKPLDTSAYTRSVRMGGQTVSGVGDPARIWDEFGKGATIVLQGLQRSWPPLTRLCRQLELELTHPVQANAYVTPAGAQGLDVHYDTHDVFVLQVAGHKEWSVHEPVLEHPLPSQPWNTSRGTPADPCLEVDLRCGGSLYVPRGFLHSARTQDGVSAHITIGVLTQTWSDVARDVVAGVVDDVEFRRSLPAGFAHDEQALAAEVAGRLASLRDWLDKVDPAEVAATVVRRFWSGRPAVLAGHLHQILALEQLHDGSTVRRRPGTVCRMAVLDGQLEVLLGDRRLLMPAALRPAVATLSSGDETTVNSLAPLLDEQSRAVLVRRLVREGLLEVVGD